MSRILSAILRGPWLIDPDWVQLNMPLINGILEGKEYSNDKETIVNNRTVPSFIDFNKGEIVSAYNDKSGAVSFNKANPGSIAIIPIIGPIIKYDGACGEVGSMTRASWIEQADMSENISAILIVLDTPGGQVAGTQTLADSIKNCSKPTIGFIEDGYCASAGYWFGSSCTELYASQKTDKIGSIGVYTTFLDVMALYESRGMKVHEIYAPQSTEKNIDYLEALKGNYDRIKEHLSFLAEEFISAVKTNREGKLNITEENDPFKGNIYFAEKAIELGLIDGIMTIEEAVKRAETLSSSEYSNSNKSNSNTHSDMKIFGKKNTAIESLKGKKAEEISSEELAAANAELLEAGIENVVLVSDDTIANSQQLAADLDAANSNIQTTSEKVTAAGFNSVEELVASEKEWKEKAIKYGADAAEGATNPKKDAANEVHERSNEEMTSWERKAAQIKES